MRARVVRLVCKPRTALVAALAVVSALASAAPLKVAVAANFQAAFAELAAHYDGELTPTYGSSGLLYAHIVQGRPFDVFLSADRARPQALVDQGRAYGTFVYAQGRLVLLVNAGSPGPAWLTAQRRVALANPATAPYGRAANETLQALEAAPRRVLGMNVAQAFHFAARGAVDGAFVALAQTLAQQTPAQRYWIVPDDLYAPIEQVAVAIRGGNEDAAGALLAYLASADAQARIQAAGYR